ncbi:MAG: hypothetical protein VKJ46_05765 [Leptolyngbyaceae bacterium]|nr:hypothetical protein [Leptolyngbyaceae bacterium]
MGIAFDEGVDVVAGVEGVVVDVGLGDSLQAMSSKTQLAATANARNIEVFIISQVCQGMGIY